MPELPEVETIKEGLKDKIVGRTIKNVEVRVAKIFQGDTKLVSGAKIKSVERRAKMLIVGLSNGYSLLIHLKMTGQLVFDSKKGDKSKRIAGGHPSDDWVKDLPGKFTHVIFNFTDGRVLYFNDLRKFGYIKVYKTDELKKLKVLGDLGPEPFTTDLTADYLLRAMARRPRLKIKQLLMDQTIISGVGNIYADEALFCAGISPLRACREVSRSELSKIIECIKKVLTLALKYRGSSENAYVDVEGRKGEMQKHFQVYQQTGKKCPRCNGVVKRTVVGGRGTHYCPNCQK